MKNTDRQSLSRNEVERAVTERSLATARCFSMFVSDRTCAPTYKNRRLSPPQDKERGWRPKNTRFWSAAVNLSVAATPVENHFTGFSGGTHEEKTAPQPPAGEAVVSCVVPRRVITREDTWCPLAAQNYVRCEFTCTSTTFEIHPHPPACCLVATLPQTHPRRLPPPAARCAAQT